jgi:hypothetical protein
MSFDQLRHQPVERAAAGSDQLQNLLTFAVAFKCSFNGFDLAPDAPNAREGLRLVFRDMRQIILREM